VVIAPPRGLAFAVMRQQCPSSTAERTASLMPPSREWHLALPELSCLPPAPVRPASGVGAALGGRTIRCLAKMSIGPKSVDSEIGTETHISFRRNWVIGRRFN
jgi:hypothetical protein